MIKLLLVDDSELITGGLAVLLGVETDLTIVDCVDRGERAVELCQHQPIDVVLMDVRMPGMSGVEATKIITETTNAKVIILTTFDEDKYIIEGIKNGAVGYLLKNTEPQQLVQAIRSVMKGQSILSQDVLEKAKQGFHPAQKTADLSSLTPREIEITRLVAAGLSNKQIANRLYLTEGTINNSLSTILHKLALEHRTQVAIYYLTGKAGDHDATF
ncbi:response regulator transcription factor [Enterococcus dongliensis]|uniref:Response regulator transcription factor n=1 Tax=Enterococcus dongliensis TaxID=2559925 RepID=A0AAP5TZW6_9ENTE|nr:response regulator transcription factor [Enterococcus dongliensis]MDT2595511.1 response regulator transcription factor [Enterococcus dongliensis]MDT2603273.1 response regulator transcription factor [Enterococcus dongliensis]MDT2612754.1 response regulator transcription factor [Enterococcus dongliensis]MDT2633636.1 response regulator transcription factor [Enterococcus dongliensis]MDT2635990.1 response regulator transcription factor [Enterococcus dongliensis]